MLSHLNSVEIASVGSMVPRHLLFTKNICYLIIRGQPLLCVFHMINDSIQEINLTKRQRFVLGNNLVIFFQMICFIFRLFCHSASANVFSYYLYWPVLVCIFAFDLESNH